MKRAAFTLIELLVVIAIIMLLVGVLTPVLASVKQQSRAINCRSNLRQLSFALSIYEHGNGTFPYAFDKSRVNPPATGYAGIGTRDGPGWWWFHYLMPILGNDLSEGTVFWCPARNIKEKTAKPNILCGNYGVNRAVSKDAIGIGSNEFWGEPLGLSQVPGPSRTLLLLDSGYSSISWWGVTNATGSDKPFENSDRKQCFYVPGARINSERTISAGFESDALQGRHPNKTINVVFVDGHSEAVPADDLFVQQTGDNFENRCPLWLP
ncbi:MAG TPA: prepilin-type N-terminal cleavage/methylation domain-containing protein [Planctomycetes bacterium]|nr:prepilin-type N-terminal cleavage/methylation domain-containing protein [Planctomycetota bacterium]